MPATISIDELERTLQEDSTFKQRFDQGPVAATREHGWTDIATQFERYLADHETLKTDYDEVAGEVEAHGLRDSAKARLLTIFVSSAAVAAWAAPIAAANPRWG